MGLLDYITATSLDEDYAAAAAKRGRASSPPAGRAKGRPGALAAVVLVVFGVLVATAAVETSRTASQTASSRDSLLQQIDDGRGKLAAARRLLNDEQSQVGRARQTDRQVAGARRTADRLAGRLGAQAGSVAVTGPGVRIVVDDAPNAPNAKFLVLDSDLRDIVNGLWEAGAEAIAVNGHRLSALSAIRVVGSAINVNNEPLVAPYTVEAIGDPKSMPARFVQSTTGTAWLNNQRQYHQAFQMTSADRLTVPATSRKGLRLVTADPVPDTKGEP